MDMHKHNQEVLVDNPADIELNKPSKSRFLFLLSFFGTFIFLLAGCYNLYEHRYKEVNTVDPPKSTLYKPEYK